MKAILPGLAQKRLRWSRASGLRLFLLLVFIIIVFGPLIALMVETAGYLMNGPDDWLSLVFPAGRRLELLVRSIALAASVAASGIVIGILASSFLWRWRTGLRAYLRWFPLMLAPLPPYVYALAWSSTTARLGPVLESFGLPDISLTGWIGSWWVHVMALLPIAVGFSLLGLESVEVQMIEAARILRSDMQVFSKVVLPLAAPAMTAGVGFLFLLSLVDYSVPSLFSVTVYPLEIFSEFSASNQPARAFLLALSLLVVTMLVITVTQSGLRNAAQTAVWHSRKAFPPPSWPTWFVWMQRAAMVMYGLQIFVILVSLVCAVGTWHNLSLAVLSAESEIIFTFWASMATAMLCLPVALAPSRELLRSDWQGRMWWLLVTAPIAIPAPLIGIGLISIWNRPIWPSIYGTAFMPTLASLARFTPLAALVLLARLRHVDPLLIDAMKIFQKNSLHAWIRVRLPLLAPGLLAAAAVAFALCLGELGATLIVAPPGQATLTIRIYNYLHYGASSAVAGLCLMMVVCTLLAGCLAIAAFAGWSRFPEESR